MADSQIRIHEATELGHALLAHVASRNGIRALSIKGQIAAIRGIREGYVSQDVDVLVEPTGAAPLLAILQDLGWSQPFASDSPGALPSHSATLVHPNWPCALDLHWRYPGFFVDPEAAFDLLWAGRSDVVLAGLPVAAPNRAGALCISVLHSLRDPDTSRSVRELQQAGSAIQSAPPEDRAELVELATGLRSLTVMGPWLRANGFAGLPDDLSGLERELWQLRTDSEPKTLPWMMEFRAAPVYRWPGIARRALFPPADYFRMGHPEVGPGTGELLRGYARRFVRGIRGIPSALRALRTSGD